MWTLQQHPSSYVTCGQPDFRAGWRLCGRSAKLPEGPDLLSRILQESCWRNVEPNNKSYLFYIFNITSNKWNGCWCSGSQVVYFTVFLSFACLVPHCLLSSFSVRKEYGQNSLAFHWSWEAWSEVTLLIDGSLKARAPPVSSWKSSSNWSGCKVFGTFQWKMFWQNKKSSTSCYSALIGSTAFSVSHASLVLRFQSLSLSCTLKFLVMLPKSL